MFDRACMIATLQRHGWKNELSFGLHGPVLKISGDFPGHIIMPVPVRLDDDHSEAMNSVYDLYQYLQTIQGRTGIA